jgi:peptidase inhibitor family I36
MAMKRTIVFAGLVLVTTALPLWAQTWGRSAYPRAGVCFYKETNFRGDYFCAGAGEDVGAVPKDMNDKISSIKVFGGAEVILFRDVRFEGRSSRFDADISNLKQVGWNDLISSIRVRGSGGGRYPGSGGGGRPSGNDAERIVRRAYEDVLGREPDASGMREYRSHIIDEGWTEAQVRDALRRSSEYRERNPDYGINNRNNGRNTLTQAQAQDIVRRAYLSVLEREPDPESRGWVDRVMRDHWTQQDVERELRKSPEYRNKRR